MPTYQPHRSLDVFAILAVVFSLMLAGCRTTGRGSPIRIAVGSATDMVYLPTTLAEKLGYYEEEKVPVLITDTAAGSKSLQALLGGSADVVTGFYDHTIQMAAEGRKIKAFAVLARFPGSVALVSSNARKKVKRIEDLKGATVGVTAPGSSSHFFINHLLVKHGLAPADVSIIAMGGGASRVAAIEHSKVDVGVLYEPGVSVLLRRSPEAAILADTRTLDGVKSVYGTETYPSAVLYTTETWLKENPEPAKRLARALTRTLQWLQAHTPEQVMEKVPPEFRGDTPEIYLEALRHSMAMYSPDGVMYAEGPEAVRKVLALSSQKVRDANIDLSTTYTNDFVAAKP